MARFILDEDYDMTIKAEIRNILADGYQDKKLMKAENAALSQMQTYLSGRYDMDKMFAVWDETGEDARDPFIVMTCIDLALYHLYSSKSTNQIPEHRSNRYEDALSWLRSAKRGEVCDSLPVKEEAKLNMRIRSHKPNNHKW